MSSLKLLITGHTTFVGSRAMRSSRGSSQPGQATCNLSAWFGSLARCSRTWGGKGGAGRAHGTTGLDAAWLAGHKQGFRTLGGLEVDLDMDLTGLGYPNRMLLDPG